MVDDILSLFHKCFPITPHDSNDGTMDLSTAILIPTFGRPHRIKQLYNNVVNTSDDCTLYFIVEESDTDTIAEIRKLGARMIVNQGLPTYASCINSAYEQTKEMFLFTGADDLHFTPNWLSAVQRIMSENSQIGVVGTFDPIHPLPDHSTHSLIRREYIKYHGGGIDNSKVLYPYWHGFTDHELLGVAKARKRYRFCTDSHVKHYHPGWDRLGRIRSTARNFDETYAKNNVRHIEDIETFVKRSQQWIHLITEKTPANKSVKKLVRCNSGVRGKMWRQFQELRIRISANRTRTRHAA